MTDTKIHELFTAAAAAGAEQMRGPDLDGVLTRYRRRRAQRRGAALLAVAGLALVAVALPNLTQGGPHGSVPTTALTPLTPRPTAQDQANQRIAAMLVGAFHGYVLDADLDGPASMVGAEIYAPFGPVTLTAQYPSAVELSVLRAAEGDPCIVHKGPSDDICQGYPQPAGGTVWFRLTRGSAGHELAGTYLRPDGAWIQLTVTFVNTSPLPFANFLGVMTDSVVQPLR